MSNRNAIAGFINVVLLLLIALAIAGCLGTKMDRDNNAIAIDIALSHAGIASEIKNNNDDYHAQASPADPDIIGYYNYSGNFYYVIIDTANLGLSGSSKNYLGHYKVLVDVDRRQVMATQYSYDVAIMPWHVQLPAYSMWYEKLRNSGVYVEMNLDRLNQSVNGQVINYNSIVMMRDHRPYMAFRLSELGEDAKTFQFSGNQTPLQTLLLNVTAIPGRMVFPGNNINGSGVSFTFNDPDHGYFFVLINNWQTDAEADVMIY